MQGAGQTPGPPCDPYDLELDLDPEVTVERHAIWKARQDTKHRTEHVYNLWFVLTIVLTLCFISGEYLSAGTTKCRSEELLIVKLLA